jgi:DNA repair protein RecN (Recombination protein N)
MQALMMLFGGKASSDLVRLGANKAIIEANFAIDGNIVNDFLLHNDIDIETSELLIRREIPTKGNSRSFVNDTPVTLNVLKQLSKLLVDFHGQNEQSKLLDLDEHLHIIDAMLENANVLPDYKTAYSKFIDTIQQYNKLLTEQHTAAERQTAIQKELKTIDSIAPKPDEDAEIDKELRLVESSESLVMLAERFLQIVDNGEHSVLLGLTESGKTLSELNQIDDGFSEFLREYRSAFVSVNEAFKFVKEYRNGLVYEPEHIEKLRQRYAELRKLVKMYGSVNEALTKRVELEQELTNIGNYDERLHLLRMNITEQRDVTSKLALSLHNERKLAANNLKQELIPVLAQLGIENATFEVHFENITANITDTNKRESPYLLMPSPVKADESGADKVEFYISTNKGEAVSPLKDAASGGEISRILLAIKSILASRDDTPLLIFDEIDTGISGRIAQKAGKLMLDLAKYHQIIAITHLPQIAALGLTFISVSKQEQGERVVTQANVLDDDARITELAKMLSGEELTDAAIKSAMELISV